MRAFKDRLWVGRSVSPGCFKPHKARLLTFNYQDQLFGRLPIDSIYGFVIETYKNDGYGRQWHTASWILQNAFAGSLGPAQS